MLTVVASQCGNKFVILIRSSFLDLAVMSILAWEPMLE